MKNQNKDWKGTAKSLFSLLGASNHVAEARAERDYYATDPASLESLLKVETFAHKIWEPACGEGHLSKCLKKYGYAVRESDIVDRIGNEVKDFLFFNQEKWDGDIITNPPYSVAQEFVEQALSCVNTGSKVAMFLRLLFCEGISRKQFFSIAPPSTIYVFSRRQVCAKNGDFSKVKSSAVCYAWFVWVKGYKGKTNIEWL